MRALRERSVMGRKARRRDLLRPKRRQPAILGRMKTIASLALLACALFVSACSNDEPATSSSYGSTSTTTSTGYSK